MLLLREPVGLLSPPEVQGDWVRGCYRTPLFDS